MNIQTPAARNTDPDTSHMAAEAFTRSGKRLSHNMRILKAIINKPGMTAGEIAEATGLTQVQVSRRTADFKKIKIEEGEPRHCKALEHRPLCLTYWPKNDFTGV